MKKLLIIDDDADIRDSLVAILEQKYEIKEAESSAAGFKMLESYKPDCILLDVMMESTSSGFEMARELKNAPQYKDIKVLMLTSVDHVMKINFKASAGDPDWLPVDDYVEKPVKPKEILDKLEKLVG